MVFASEGIWKGVGCKLGGEQGWMSWDILPNKENAHGRLKLGRRQLEIPFQSGQSSSSDVVPEDVSVSPPYLSLYLIISLTRLTGQCSS
jgi:hypothetical protein